MISVRHKALLAAIAAASSLAFGTIHAQDDLETIVVSGKRLTVRKAVVAFVHGITRLDGDFVSRWREPICPLVAGGSDALNDIILARLRVNAKAVSAPHARDDKCPPNLFVVMTPDPDDFVEKWKQIDTGMFRWKPRTGVARSKDGPVRTWHNAELQPVGAPKDETGGSNMGLAIDVPRVSGGNGGSRITRPVEEYLSAAVVLIDAKAIANLTPTQLADHVAMVSFAKLDTTVEFGTTPTILRVFSSEPDTAAELTEWDKAFLRALYGQTYSSAHPRMAITAAMSKQLREDRTR